MIWEWIEHPFLWAVRIRPAELFDQDTVDDFPRWEEWDDPNVDGEPMGSLSATNVLTGQRGRYIAIYDKRWFSRRQVEVFHDGEDEWDRRYAHQLAQLPPERWLEFYQPTPMKIGIAGKHEGRSFALTWQDGKLSGDPAASLELEETAFRESGRNVSGLRTDVGPWEKSRNHLLNPFAVIRLAKATFSDVVIEVIEGALPEIPPMPTWEDFNLPD